ncbi:hypothetical protein GJV85_02810 [Sulfurimonas aquatica]|uniref:Uncharacterized protein n=1 Tax=Sulfurimonas aquatica TaxID=2672570 RepID=A0A975GBZ5_9BACT|nr:hypothetical protein [Sulfurimonas aquatica]QSZ41090.1 hypothetical protein GJV85_02810 [Sulfurimonas aquatica]
MNNNDVELNAKELFLGLAMVLHSTAGNIENQKMSYEDARELYTKVLPDISRMILEEHSDDEMISAAKKMGALLNEIAKSKGVEITE